MLAIPKLRISKVKLGNLMLALMVITAVSGVFLYFIETDRIGGDFLAGIFPLGQEEEVKEEVVEINQVVDLRDEYIESAQAGDGLTHLARRAVDRYLDDIGEEIGAERRVYVEDYIQKSLGGGPLSLGEEVSISRELIIEAVALSFELNPTLIENLEQYSSLVLAFN